MMPTLDYRTPPAGNPPRRWARRYAIFIPAFAALHLGLTFFSAFVYVDYFDPPSGRHPPEPIVIKLLTFPSNIFDPNDLTWTEGIFNSIVAASLAVGVWHAASKLLKGH